MDGKLRIGPQFGRLPSQVHSQSVREDPRPGLRTGQGKTFDHDAVRLNVRGKDDAALAKVYTKLSARSQSVRGRPADYASAPVEPLPNSKPVAPDATREPAKGLEGLFRKEADGSTTVAFDGITLNIKEDGAVEGTIISPKGDPLAIKGTFKDGKITADVEKLGTYTAQLSFSEGSTVKGADGKVLLTDVQQVSAPATPVPTKPKPPEGASVEGIVSGDTAYFGGFNVTFGKDGQVSVQLNSPDGRTILGKGSINDKGEITVRFDDPKTGFDGSTYTGVYSRDEKGRARISDIRFVGKTAAPDASQSTSDKASEVKQDSASDAG